MGRIGFFQITKLKIVLLILTFIIIFFINIPALFEPCNWLTRCPDFLGVNVISIYPNFYTGVICGGLTGECYEPNWSIKMFIFDVILWIIVNLIIFLRIYRSEKYKEKRNFNHV